MIIRQLNQFSVYLTLLYGEASVPLFPQVGHEQLLPYHSLFDRTWPLKLFALVMLTQQAPLFEILQITIVNNIISVRMPK